MNKILFLLLASFVLILLIQFSSAAECGIRFVGDCHDPWCVLSSGNCQQCYTHSWCGGDKFYQCSWYSGSSGSGCGVNACESECTPKCGPQPNDNFCGPNPLGQCENCNSQDTCTGLGDFQDFYCTSSGMCGSILKDCSDCSCSCGGYGINEFGGLYCTDGIDNDCDTFIDCADSECSSNCINFDKDGYDTCSPSDYCDDGKPKDCVDTDANINPGKTEICTNTFDDNCNGDLDCADSDCNLDPACVCKDLDGDGVDTCAEGHVNGDSYPTDCDDTNALWWFELGGFVDKDSDGFGSDVSKECCTGFAIKPGCALNDDDCRDKNADINPGKKEKCLDWGSIDEDCDTLANCNDPDCFCKFGFENGKTVKCSPIGGIVKGEDCDNGWDDDCDELVDCQDDDCKGDIFCLGGGGGSFSASCSGVDIGFLRTMCKEGNGLADVAIGSHSDACYDRGGLSCSGDYIEFSHSLKTSPEKIPAGEETSFLVKSRGLSSVTPGLVPADFMFLLDRSSSMKDEIETAKTALQNIFIYLKNKDAGFNGNSFQAGVASFNHEAQINQFLNFVELVNLDINDGCGCTDISSGVDDAVNNFNTYSCQQASVKDSIKKVMVLISDGEGNRDGLGSVPSDVTVYTIGINVEQEWADELKNIAETFGTGDGVYYSINSTDRLGDVLEGVANRYIAEDSADEIVVRIKLTEDFEFENSYLSVDKEGAKVYDANWISSDGKTIEWNLGNVIKDVLKTLKVDVKARYGLSPGVKDVIVRADSFVDVYNECSVLRESFGQISVQITEDAPHKCNEIQRIMKIDIQNRFGALWNGNDILFPYDVCYNTIYGKDYIPDEDEDVHVENNNFVAGLKDGKAYLDGVLLSPVTGFVINPEFGGDGIFFGDLNCKLESSCSPGYKCVVSVSGRNDAFIFPCGLIGSFSNMICCKSLSFVDDAYWTDKNNLRTTSAEIGERVKMVWESQDILFGGSYNFDIKERDEGFDSDEDIKTMSNVIGENGRVTAEWTISQADWDKAKEDTESYFYFEVNGEGGADIGYNSENDLVVSGETIPDEWVCENGEYYSYWYNLEEFPVDTKRGLGSCSGGDYGTKGDCCPTGAGPTGAGWNCVDVEGEMRCVPPEDYKDICENVFYCSDYNGMSNDEMRCGNDIAECGVGRFGHRQIDQFPIECYSGGADVGKDTSTVDKIGCAWKDTRCYQTKELNWVFDSDSFSVTCNNSFVITQTCELNDRMSVNVIVDDIFWKPLPLPFDISKLDTDECRNAVCQGGEKEFLCAKAVLKLPFFSWIGFIGVGILLILFYWRKCVLHK